MDDVGVGRCAEQPVVPGAGEHHPRQGRRAERTAELDERVGAVGPTRRTARQELDLGAITLVELRDSLQQAARVGADPPGRGPAELLGDH